MEMGIFECRREGEEEALGNWGEGRKRGMIRTLGRS